MFSTLDELEAVIDQLAVDATSEDITRIHNAIDTLQAKEAIALGRFDADNTWALDTATSTTNWVKHHLNLPAGRAGGLVRTARIVHAAPELGSAWESGALAGGKVTAVVANVADRHQELFASHAPGLLDDLTRLSVDECAQLMGAWRNTADNLISPREQHERANEARLSKTLDDRRELKGSFDALSGAVIDAALDAARTGDCEGEQRTPAQRTAQALVDVCRYYLDHQHAAHGRRNRPHVNVTIDRRDLAAGTGGHVAASNAPLTEADIRSLLCDSNVHRHLTDGPSEILDRGRAHRTATAAQFNALVVRDGHCRHPGCDRPPDWCEAHHAIAWEQGGATDLTNLVLKCSRHHHLGHQPGWRETLDRDGTLHLTDPTGRQWTTHPPGQLRLHAA